MKSMKKYQCEECGLECFNVNLFENKWICTKCYTILYRKKEIKYQKKLREGN